MLLCTPPRPLVIIESYTLDLLHRDLNLAQTDSASCQLNRGTAPLQPQQNYQQLPYSQIEQQSRPASNVAASAGNPSLPFPLPKTRSLLFIFPRFQKSTDALIVSFLRLALFYNLWQTVV